VVFEELREEMGELRLTCADCGREFTFGADEQALCR
jgi:hypothetical protein